MDGGGGVAREGEGAGVKSWMESPPFVAIRDRREQKGALRMELRGAELSMDRTLGG